MDMKEELDRKYRVINMMITMHSILYHRYRKKSLIGKIFFLISAIILNVFMFAAPKELLLPSFIKNNVSKILTISSFSIFLLSVIFLLIEWPEKSEKHLNAINQLSRLLNKLRSIKKEKNLIDESEINLFDELYNQTFETIPKVQDKIFNSLKAKHYQKVELSKFIDKHKGKPFFIIKLIFLWEKILKKDEMQKK